MAGLFQIVKNGNHEGYGIKYCIVLTNAGVQEKSRDEGGWWIKEIFEFTITSACGKHQQKQIWYCLFSVGRKKFSKKVIIHLFTYKLNGMPCMD